MDGELMELVMETLPEAQERTRVKRKRIVFCKSILPWRFLVSTRTKSSQHCGAVQACDAIHSSGIL